MTIAITFPGKMGDLLYSLPTVKYISASNGNEPIDFYTSIYCRPLEKLLRYQPYIQDFIIPSNYVLTSMDCGIQPWLMPVDESKYSKVYHLGFRKTPDRPLYKHIANEIGLKEPESISYFYPQIETLDHPYIVFAPHGIPLYTNVIRDFYSLGICDVVMVGLPGEYPGFGINMCGADFLDVLSWLAKSKGFVGRGANYVLAEGFNIPIILPTSGHEFDTRHLITDEHHFYPTNPTVDDYINMLNIQKMEIPLKTFSKTLNTLDYTALGGYSQHISNMLIHFDVNKIPYGAFNHEHRKWEYGMVYKALSENGSKSILDIGGNGCIFAPAMAWVGMSVHELDLDNSKGTVEIQSNSVNKNPITFECVDFVQYDNPKKYDAVVAISVIEHVPDHEKFFRKMLALINDGGLVCLTTDFHPSGEQIVPFHLRTYNKESLMKLAKIAKKEGFSFYKGEPDYDYFAPNVNGCDFATLIMKKD